MIRLYAWERAQALRCKLVYRGYDRGNTRTFGLAGRDLPSHSRSTYT